MTLDLLIFGPAAAAAQADRVTLTMPDQPAVTAAAVLRAAADQHPALADLARSGGARLAVNHQFARPDDPVRPGDEIALIAMVSGG